MSNGSKFGRTQYDAIVVGAGPNGLACAITLAQQNLNVALIERASKVGGGARSEELTLPGFLHDVCSAVHPLGVASPFLKSLPLHEYGLKWIYSPAEAVHPLDDGRAILLKRSVIDTAAALGRDEKTYVKFFSSFENKFEAFVSEVMQPAVHIPQSPWLLTRFGLRSLLSAKTFSETFFKDEAARALFMGIAAHSSAPLTDFASTAVGLVLQIAGHGDGWPLPEGGARSITGAMARYFEKLGGEIVLDRQVNGLDDLPAYNHVFFDLTPRQILKIAGDKLPSGVRRSFENFRYGAGVFKIDWALNAPVPWKNPDCALSATVHIGGTSSEVIDSEECANHGRISQKPYVLFTQPTLFDPTRAPNGKHIAWAYCHVPHGSTEDMTAIVENQIERFAPGFKKTILKRNTMNTAQIEARNPNLVGGDISGGSVATKQLFFRPRVSLNPYALDGRSLWICSSSTPPGPGVHGMCGFLAAQRALKGLKS